MSGEISKCPARDSWFAGQNVRRSSKSFHVLWYTVRYEPTCHTFFPFGVILASHDLPFISKPPSSFSKTSICLLLHLPIFWESFGSEKRVIKEITSPDLFTCSCLLFINNYPGCCIPQLAAGSLIGIRSHLEIHHIHILLVSGYFIFSSFLVRFRRGFRERVRLGPRGTGKILTLRNTQGVAMETRKSWFQASFHKESMGKFPQPSSRVFMDQWTPNSVTRWRGVRKMGL